MKTNKFPPTRPVAYTHGGAITHDMEPLEKLRRAVLSCLILEDSAYESGSDTLTRIQSLVTQVPPHKAADLAVQARNEQNLRHIPLFITRELARNNYPVSTVLEQIIQRPDELTEFLSMYWKDGRQPLSAQVKKGLAKAFAKFDEYSLAKYNQNREIRLRDVMFLTRPKPKNPEQAEVWKRLANNKLSTPDTWESAKAAGKGTKEAFERLLRSGHLGYLALLRNLRAMANAKVSESLIKEAILARRNGAEKVLPFRYIAAATAAPQFEEELNQAFLGSLADAPKLPGTTIVVIDVSGSMYYSNVSRKSDMTRAHAACALGAIAREICETPIIYATAGSDALRKHKTIRVPARRGIALTEAIYKLTSPLGGGGIFLKQVMDYIRNDIPSADRVIVITDEQDCSIDAADSPDKAILLGNENYIINVATYEHGIAQKKWTHINGFSESVMTYIREVEKPINN